MQIRLVHAIGFIVYVIIVYGWTYKIIQQDIRVIIEKLYGKSGLTGQESQLLARARICQDKMDNSLNWKYIPEAWRVIVEYESTYGNLY